MYYAQLNDKNICVAISELSGEVHKENMIKIPAYDISILGKKYADGKWERVEPEPTPEPPLSETEQAILDTAINVDYLVCLRDMEL